MGNPPLWLLHLIVVKRFEYASDPESYTSGRLTGLFTSYDETAF